MDDVEKHRTPRATAGAADDDLYSPSSSSPHSRSSSYAAEEVYEQPQEAGKQAASRPLGLSRVQSTASSASAGKTIIGLEPDDPENPYNWSQLRKASIVLIGIITVLNSTIGSSIPSGDLPGISARFGVTSDEQQVLPISIYLVGYVLGPLLFGPLSESYGRQVIMIGTFLGYFIFTLGTCFAPTWTGFLFFRVLAGAFASSPISVTGGLYADLYKTPAARGRAMALFMAATVQGPIGGPIASGYLGVYSWRWPFWFVLIFAGASLIPLAFLPETYIPVILQRRARKMRKEEPGSTYYAPLDLENTGLRDLVVTFLGRPFRMLFTEALVAFSCLYMSLVYATFYILLIAFPQIFPPVYGFSLGEEGLAFLGIGIGGLFAAVSIIWWDSYLVKAKARDTPWSRIEEYRRLPLACIGGPLFTISLFWIGWSARPDVHWIVPIIGGFPLGLGYVLLFMALLNYIVDAYQVYSASALAASACSRSLFGAVVPFATTPMYNKLGIAWACSLLGFLALAMCAIPFAFIKWGGKIREHSKFCQELAQLQLDREAKEEKRRARQKRLAESAEKAV